MTDSNTIIESTNIDKDEINLENFFAHYDNDIISPEQALRILEQLKTAVLNKDIEIINSICTILKQNTFNTGLYNIVENTCDTLFKDTACTSTIIKYTFPTEDRPNPKENILVLNDGYGSCKHAIIYVDSDFDYFDDEEINYIKSLNIEQIDIIDEITDNKIYSGFVDENIEIRNDDDTRNGWLILIGVIILIGMGLTISQMMNK